MRLPYVIGAIYMLIINAVIIFYEETLGPVGVGIFMGATLLYASWCMVTPLFIPKPFQNSDLL